jgi:hypothetical protein
MTIQNPFSWVSHAVQKRAFVVLLVSALFLLACLNVLDRPLKTSQAPLGIVSFELAGSLAKAQGMVNSWDTRGKIFAGLSLGLDYLFLVVYGAAIGLACGLVARGLASFSTTFSNIGLLLAWGQIVAALLDGVENYALIQVLLGSGYYLWPVLARLCAVPKFAIVFAGLLYGLGGAVVIFAKNRSTRG